MKINVLLLLSLIMNLQVAISQSLIATDVVDKSIAYHDPEGLWNTFTGTLHLAEEREEGDRYTKFSIDNSNGKWVFERDQTKHGMLLDSCFTVSGEAECERIETIRNYYLYLWGLPMKLKDKGTPILPRAELVKDWHGREVYSVEVHYDRENWTYFFDSKTYALLGYEFMFNHKEGGELILLEGLEAFEQMNFPKERTWYELPAETYLAKDILIKVE